MWNASLTQSTIWPKRKLLSLSFYSTPSAKTKRIFTNVEQLFISLSLRQQYTGKIQMFHFSLEMEAVLNTGFEKLRARRGEKERMKFDEVSIIRVWCAQFVTSQKWNSCCVSEKDTLFSPFGGRQGKWDGESGVRASVCFSFSVHSLQFQVTTHDTLFARRSYSAAFKASNGESLQQLGSRRMICFNFIAQLKLCKHSMLFQTCPAFERTCFILKQCNWFWFSFHLANLLIK